MSQLNDAYRVEEALFYQYLTNFDCPRHIEKNRESWCLRDFNQNLISSPHLELDQYQIIDKMTSFYSNEI